MIWIFNNLTCVYIFTKLVKALVDRRSKVWILRIPPKNVDNYQILHLGRKWEAVPYF